MEPKKETKKKSLLGNTNKNVCFKFQLNRLRTVKNKCPKRQNEKKNTRFVKGDTLSEPPNFVSRTNNEKKNVIIMSFKM